MYSVLFVFAEMFDELRIRKQLEAYSHRLPGLRISLRVIDREVHFQVSEIRAAEAFSDLQRVRVRVTAIVQPGSLFESSRLDNKRVAFPLPDRVPEPGRIGILWERAAIGENLPILIEFLVENHEFTRRLDNLERDVGNQHRIRHAVRHAMQLWLVSPQALHALLVQGRRPWMHRYIHALAGKVIQETAISVPDTREIRLTVGGFRGRRRQVGLAVRRA